MTSATMKLLPLACLCLLTRSGTAFAAEQGSVIIIMKEGSDVILPCSFSTKDDIENNLFYWAKDDRTSVFRYDAGLHYNNGLPGQYEHFKGRVSYFEDERKYGNFSIIIRNLTVADSGNYTCYGPHLTQPVRIQLVFGPMIVKEGSDAILPCTNGPKDTEEKRFNWKKDGQQVVFRYFKGFSLGFPNQDKQFEGRVSHFPDLKHGTAAILIKNLKVTDSGIYTCDFSSWRGQLLHVQLVVVAAPRPYITKLNETEDSVLLECVFRGNSSKPTVEWQDRSGNILPAETQVSERGGSFNITLQTTVTKTDGYRCVTIQEEFKHPIYAEIYVPFIESVIVKEGSDAMLPCSHSSKEDIGENLFEWTKDGQKRAFIYNGGLHFNNGLPGQLKQLKGRVSHFQDELKFGNASIIIRNTTVADSGNYTCVLPILRPQPVHIQLFVGAAPEPYVTILNESRNSALLQCEVQGASPKPTVEWQDSVGNILPAEEPQISERGGSFFITLQTTVKKTDNYRCVATQEEISHQIYTEIYVPFNEPPTRWVFAAVLVSPLVVCVLLAPFIYRLHQTQS